MTPCQRISPTGGHHFFAYYDKLQFSTDERYVLMQRAEFGDRQPRPEDVLTVGMIDRESDNAWTELGKTNSWCWQQGCMLQWIPGSDSRVIHNVRGEKRHEAVIVDAFTGEKQLLPRAVYCVHPSGNEAISLDFARIAHTRPGYGYEGISDPNRDAAAPRDSGVYRMRFDTGEVEQLLSVAQVAAIDTNDTMDGAIHWFNHALYNPSGSRFIVLHRWQGQRGRETRMYTCNRDGSGLFRISDSSRDGSWHASHFWWCDDHTIMMWGEYLDERGGAYLIVEDESATPRRILDRDLLTCDGHMSCRPGDVSRWVLSDTYPDRETNVRELFLFDLERDERIVLGAFDAGPFNSFDPATNMMRCDLHPRWDRRGRRITFDSVHEGFRGVYMVDVSPVTDA